MKNFLVLFMFVFLVACEKQKPNIPEEPIPQGSEKTECIEDAEPQEQTLSCSCPCACPAPVEIFKTNISYSGTKATEARKAKYEQAIIVLKKVIASKEFKDRVYAHKYDGISGFASSVATPSEVYAKLLSGAEKLSLTVDNELDMIISFYYADTSVIGYTYATTKTVYVNTKYFDNYRLNSVAANLLHEYMHKLGYGHDSSATARRPYSVPYALGNIMRELGAKFL